MNNQHLIDAFLCLILAFGIVTVKGIVLIYRGIVDVLLWVMKVYVFPVNICSIINMIEKWICLVLKDNTNQGLTLQLQNAKIMKRRWSMTDELFKCPKCGRECMIEFENEKGYRLRCIHCLKDIVRWKNEWYCI